ncbi:MAG TPA: sugar O-acetyltransferase [Candidatus Caccosoma faecigallinarum]|jgi:acetyltransferase (isoleucine patch superfamily)|uniref:Acetyltransferase n=1 Tax=Candidatus Caccosoma faecigallinarum TaxID=2840720 RepID=A0A9D1KAV6_9FIRM|nr:acetyltransferase (Isoleucine patch superfamily) [Firmicutes bacterium CAG:631]HIT17620.1 sugar O-acetyltransferase [Candidatus Caccosoma faecigallinarum]
MTEKEKMLANQLYDPSDAELVQLRRLARNKMMEFNHLNDDELPKRKEILQSILGHLGKDSFIETGLLLDYGCNTYIGNDCFINYNCTILDCAKVVIKDNVFIGPNVSLYTPLHSLIAKERNMRTDATGRKFDLEYCKPITIEENVWIAGNVIINPGVTIKKNSVIGSGSVVTHDIPEGVLAAGNPCKVIREITKKDCLE